MKSELPTSSRGNARTAALVSAGVAIACLLLGVLGLVEGRVNRVLAIVGFAVLLIPVAYFLTLTWASVWFARTGARWPYADQVGGFFARLNDPVIRRRQRPR